MASVLESLPDIVILKVISFLNTHDVLNLSKCGDVLESYCSDYTIVRNTSFEGSYYVNEEEFKDYIRKHGSRIESLSLNHCYWMTQRLISWAIQHCASLRSLSVVECRLKVNNLVSLISRLPQLDSIAFSVQSFNDLKKDVFNPCRNVLKNVKSLYLYYSSRELAVMHYLGEHHTIFDHCESLEHIHIGSAGMAIPELYRPIVTEPPKFANLKSMCISSNIHAGAQMLFYGTLSQLPNDRIKFETLLMPNVNFPEFMRKAEFKACLQNIEHFKHLDIYGSKVSFPIEFIEAIKRAKDLRYLSLGASRVTDSQLSYIASHCHKLTSVNLYNCAEILQLSGEGLEALFRECEHLKHLNISGEHHHINDNAVASSLSQAVRGLVSLSVPTCMLSRQPERRKRSAPCRCAEPPSKRKCLSSSSPSNNLRSSCHHDDSQPGTSSGYSSGRTSLPRNSDAESFLGKLVRNNPDLRELEIIAADLTSAIHQNKFIKPKVHKAYDPCLEARQVSDSTLEPLTQLGMLRSLTLMGLPGVNTGQCVMSIARQCDLLQSLHIGFLGTALNSTHFYRAFEYMNNLIDLRIEQPNLNLRKELFESISRCPNLQRLCIIAKHSAFNPSHVTAMLDQLGKVISLQIFAGGQVNSCKALVTSLKHKYSRSRPALSIAICPLLHDRIAQTIATSSSPVPAKHFDELTRFCSRVASYAGHGHS